MNVSVTGLNTLKIQIFRVEFVSGYISMFSVTHLCLLSCVSWYSVLLAYEVCSIYEKRAFIIFWIFA